MKVSGFIDFENNTPAENASYLTNLFDRLGYNLVKEVWGDPDECSWEFTLSDGKPPKHPQICEPIAVSLYNHAVTAELLPPVDWSKLPMQQRMIWMGAAVVSVRAFSEIMSKQFVEELK